MLSTIFKILKIVVPLALIVLVILSVILAMYIQFKI